MTASNLKQWIESGEDLTIIDVLPYDNHFRKEHVPGAKQFLFPRQQLRTWNSQLTGNRRKQDYEAILGRNKDKKIVVYGESEKCARSHNGAIWAKNLGYKNVFRFLAGIEGWKAEEFQLESV